MKIRSLMIGALIIFIGLSVLFFVSCGGLDLTPQQQTNAVKAWTVIGDAGLTPVGAHFYLSLDVYRDTPYVAYDGATVIKFNGTSWEVVGSPGFSAGLAAYLSLAVYNGTPYLAYQDAYDYGFGTKEFLGNRATVMEWNGATWEVVGQPAFSPAAANYLSLAVYTGAPYVAFQNMGFNDGATLMKFDGTSWEGVGAPGFAGAATYTSLAIYNGTPYVAFVDANNGIKTTVMRFNGGTWEAVGSPGFSAVAAYNTCLAIDNGTPYIAYVSYPVADVTPTVTVMKFNGVSWEGVGAQGFVQTEQQELSLQVYNGMPYVAIVEPAIGLDINKTSVLRFDGSGWDYVGKQAFSPSGQKAGHVCISINDSGTPYIAFADYYNNYKITVMAYK